MMSPFEIILTTIEFIQETNRYTDEKIAQIFESIMQGIRTLSGAMILTMIIFFYFDYRKNRKPDQNEDSRSKLKLEAQKINEFSGSSSEWPKWRNRTECALDGSGYEDVLENRAYASKNQEYNRVVYGQLSVATVDGTAHHLVKKYSKTKDGHAAWKALVDWYDGDSVKNETAEEIRSKIDNLVLHSQVSASHYVNKFSTWKNDLDKIPGEGFSPSHTVYLFLRNISDPEYDTTIQFLKNNKADFDECVSAVRKYERELSQKRAQRRKMKNLVRRYHEELKTTATHEDRHGNNDPDERTTKIRRFNGKITPNPRTNLLAVPSQDWRNLEKEKRDFITDYNSRVKHGESIENLVPPDGLTILKNTPRRTNEDIDVVMNDPDPDPPTKRKRITFKLDEERENEADDETTKRNRRLHKFYKKKKSRVR